jgi:murein DD-endopeptidase MepM/ murein hydrolase activator NlpD
VEYSPYLPGEPNGMQGPESTDALAGAVQRLSDRRHESSQKAFLDVAGPFPLAGPAHWSNDWHAYRPCPYPHVHEGLDLIAARGTPIVAVAGATVTEVVNDPRMSGLGIGITDPNGVRYFYAHMDHFAANMHVGLEVRVGQVIGFVGNTGDAAGGPTHLHFEVRPGGVPVPPKPYVDRWLLAAEAKARALVRQHARRGRDHDVLPLGVRTSQPTGTVQADVAARPVSPPSAPARARLDAHGLPPSVDLLLASLVIFLVATTWTGAAARRRRPLGATSPRLGDMALAPASIPAGPERWAPPGRPDLLGFSGRPWRPDVLSPRDLLDPTLDP